MATPAQQSSPATILALLGMKQTSSPSGTSYFLWPGAFLNTTF